MRILIAAIWLALSWPVTLLCGQPVINEIIALNPFETENPLTGQPGDWIEIHNPTDSPVGMVGLFLSDDPGNPTKWKFPSGISIPPGGYLLVFGENAPPAEGRLQAGFNLDGGGEHLVIYSPVAGIVDSMVFPRQYDSRSYGLLANGEYAFFTQPTPGSANEETSSYQVSGPVSFSPPGGIHTRGLEVSLTGHAGGTIRYTTDGSDPGPTDPVYADPLPVGSDQVVRARQYEPGKEPGEIFTASYLFRNALSLPVVSLATDPDNLWDDQTGIHVSGTNGIPGYCSDMPRNWNQDWERPVNLEYFDRERNSRIQMDLGIKIHGGCSRQANLKSFGIFARNEYGSNRMEYPFFREKDIDEFKGLILRNAGNDNQYTYIRDAAIQASVSTDMDLDYQAYDPVHVYLNGQYWGIMNLREKVNEHWVTSNYGIPAENVDFIKNRNEVFAGSADDWNDLMNFMEQHSLADDGNYNQVAARLDIGSYIDYLVTQMFFANRDWPGNNIKYWRDRVNGSRWRFIMFDMEFSMGLYDFNPAINMFEFVTADDVYEWPNPTWATLPIRKLLENKGFRDMFLQRYLMYLNTTLHPDRVTAVIDSIQQKVAPSFQGHIDRWHLISNMDVWNNRVEELRNFTRQRPAHVRTNMQQFFSLGDPFELRIEPTGPEGTIRANGIRVPYGGMTGEYAGQVALELAFEPTPGYAFSHWEIQTVQVSEMLLVPSGSLWKYNDSGTDPGPGWTAEGYDDSGWSEGPGELGYGDGGEATELDYGPDPENKHTTYYFRKAVDLEEAGGLEQVTLRLMRDDGAVVYVNGQEVFRDNMPEGTVTPATFALDFIGGGDESAYNAFTLGPEHFKQGINIIAVEIHQNSLTSSDISFDMELSALRGSSGEEQLVVTEPVFSFTPTSSTTVRAFTEEVELELELVINEVMAANQGAWPQGQEDNGDWIEVYNPGSEAVDMAGLCFTDSLELADRVRIPYGYPEETTIQAGGFLVFIADGNPLAGPRHLDFRLDADGESVGLSYLSGSRVVWLDTLRFTGMPVNQSLGRYPDGAANWQPMFAITPGASNIITLADRHKGPEEHLLVYPNPTRDLLRIRLSGTGADAGSRASVRLTDLSGRTVFISQPGSQHPLDALEIDVSGIVPGIYFLVVETGNLVYSEKVIVSR